VHRPELLVLDEPTNGLDPQARHQLLQILRQLAAAGTTLLVVTHQLDAVIPEISRAVLIKGGRIQANGPCRELLRADPLSRLFDTPLRVVEAGGWRQLLPA
jgi:iron complex transport system ATP-binding protein